MRGAGRQRSIARMGTPPTINAGIPTGGVNRCAVIQWCVSSPTSAAGRNATSSARTRRRDSAAARPSFTTRHNRSRYSQTTARMAPSWMMISKAAARGPTKPSAWPARIRWPVDETGRNSVAPSTSPRMIAAKMVGTASSYTTPGRERHAAPVQRDTVYTERDVDVAACGVRVRAALVGSTHQIFGVAARQARHVDVQGDRQAEATVTGGTDSHPRGDARVGGIELPTLGHRQQRGLEAGSVPDGEQLLWIGTRPALAAHLPRDGQVYRESPVGRPAMAGSPSFNRRLGCVQDVHVSSWVTALKSRASGPTAAARAGTTSSDVGRWLISRSVTLPTTRRVTDPFPCEPTTSKSACHSPTSRPIVFRAAPYQRTVSTPGARIRGQISSATFSSKSR